MVVEQKIELTAIVSITIFILIFFFALFALYKAWRGAPLL